jgi:hypothetical protein
MLSPFSFSHAKFLKIVSIAGCIFLSLSGCNQDPKKPPIEEEKFISIMIDIHLLEARLENLKQLNDTSFFAAGKGYEQIYKNHSVTKEQFRQTFDFYLNHPKQMDKLYEKIVDSLSEMEATAKE